MNTFFALAMTDAITLERVSGWFTFAASAIIVLGALIVAHEFGHYIVARLVGVRVDKFSIGFGPKIFGFTKGNTEYMLSWVPLGGYVKLYGDDPQMPVENEAESFLNQPVWKRLSIVIAGPAFNIILAIGIITLAAMIGMPEGTRIIKEIKEGTPAAAAGLMADDRIDAVDGQKMELWHEIVEVIQKSPGKQVILTINRGGKDMDISVTPASVTGKTIDGKDIAIGQIGIMSKEIYKQYPPHEAVVRGVEWTWNMTTLTVWGIGKMLMRDIPASQIAGPIGIMKMAGDVAETGFVSLLKFIALISVNLGILNLLPIPVLDGGHIMFFSIEAVLGKPLKLRYQEMAQQVGIFILLSLMVFAFYNDIVRLIAG